MNVKATLVRTVQPVITLMMPSAAHASQVTMDLDVEQTSMNVAVTLAITEELVQILSTISLAHVLWDTMESSAKIVRCLNNLSNQKYFSLSLGQNLNENALTLPRFR